MGCCQSVTEQEKENRLRNKEIEEELRETRKVLNRMVKMLLLGAGESGKSTVAKQMRIIYLEGFSNSERDQFKAIIYSNLATSMAAMLRACQQFQYELLPDNQPACEYILSTNFMISSDMSEDLARFYKSLWGDPAIQQALSRASEYQLYDSTEFYFADLDRILAPSWVPSEQDILRARAKTTGITETDFEVDGMTFKMVDVGGQRSERKKWIHCFQDVTCVVFVTSLSEYDQMLYEDHTVRRIDESLKLFDEVCNSRWFLETNIILFLNKSDIFKEKIKKTDLSVCFPEYKGGPNFNKATNYIRKKFTRLNKNAQRAIYTHVTCATDTENIKFVFNVVKDIIIKKVLAQISMS